jgi:hypothetical protein
MSYTLPTPVQFRAYVPAFSTVSDDTINLYLNGAQVDNTWIEADYQAAVMLWAAWAMTDAGIGAGGDLAAARQAGVSKLKSGSLDVSFAADNAATGYETNIYGRRFLGLYRKSKGGPRVVRGATGPCGWGPTGQTNNGGLLPWVC